jgi:F5/8 type C domain
MLTLFSRRSALFCLALTVGVTCSAFAQAPIPRSAWRIQFVDSQETEGENGAATNVFDGNLNSIWVTQWYRVSPGAPHEIQIDLGATYAVSGLRYLPRQDGDENGRIADYQFYVSSDGVNWGTAVSAGVFPNTGDEAERLFTPKTGRFIRLRALSEVNGNPWTSLAELNVLATGPGGAGAGQSPQVTWTMTEPGVLDAPASIQLRVNATDSFESLHDSGWNA